MDPGIAIVSFGTALTMVVFGVHQWRKPQEWVQYVPPFVRRLSPLGEGTLMRAHAAGNVVLGLFLVSMAAPYLALLLAFLWWLSIVPFAFRVNWTIGMRDLSVTLSLLGALVWTTLL